MKKSLFTKVLAVVLTLAMVLGLSTTALAADGVYEPESGETAITSVDITKIVTTDGNTYKPNTTFSYTVATASEGSYADTNGTTYTVLAGPEGGLTTTPTTSSPSATEDVSASYTITGGSLNVESSKFTAPGVYHYTLSETKGDYEGIVYDATTYDIYVFVYQDDSGTNYVGNIVSTKTEDSTVTKTDLTFTNNYGMDTGTTDPDPSEEPDDPSENNDSTHDVTITKEISGSFASVNDEFEFSVSISVAGCEIYKVVYYTSSSDTTGATTSVTSGSTITVSGIKATGKIVIYGLTASDTYTVEEKDYTSDGYTTTVTYDDGTTEVSSNTDTTKAVGTVIADGADVTIRNTNDAGTPTGLIFTYGPYALMVLIALAGCVVFFRRRRTTMD